jgi:hypothetical protein
MDHDDAIRCQAATRYVGGELAPADRDAFEEHFFDCQECAEEVRWEQIFAANARAVAREQPALPPPSRFWETWRAWLRVRPALALSLAANAALVLGFVYVTTSAGRLGTQARLLPAFFTPPPAKGADDAQTLSVDADFLARFPAPDQPYPSYYYQILDPAGHQEYAGTVLAPAAGAPELCLEVSVKRLHAGLHRLEIASQPGGEIIAQLRFRTSH